ncbi:MULTISPECIES: acetyltransferase [Pseudomonas]|uniref:acetyltransferase n=1 Tax=Pseudomonas TaxID=286 RepID=UPI00209DD9D1|nr:MULTISPECIES: acetyltransferase [Pseudomonas]MCP1515296.1 sugar O-acyltransferase (sialic acid O-acetyltransferase NeuD family) [Pseudomonas rhodesiae]MDF9769031.1 sugar O-acyltransferase (sialic acid O-acetyltransferase NeuD family) [Pseudomonas rhodesiae]
MKKLAILGAGGHGKVVADAAECCGWAHISFFEDSWPDRSQNAGWEICGTTSDLLKRLDEFQGVIVAIGHNQARGEKLSLLESAGAEIVSIVHPSATVSRYAEIGRGSVVFAGACVNACAIIGTGAIINTGSSVDHDCVLGTNVHICPGARLAGNVTVGDYSWVGIGSCVKQMVCIGMRVTVGAGSAVVKDIYDDLVVVGVPARPVKSS